MSPQKKESSNVGIHRIFAVVSTDSPVSRSPLGGAMVFLMAVSGAAFVGPPLEGESGRGAASPEQAGGIRVRGQGQELRNFRRGDTNADGRSDISDAIAALGFLFLGKPEKLACEKSADVNDDGKIDLSDPIALLGYLFLGVTAPPEPSGACGTDGTPGVEGASAKRRKANLEGIWAKESHG
jgi:hypothetical protein